MIIQKRRIQRVDRYFRLINPGNNIILGLSEINRFVDRLYQCGFSQALDSGERVLPRASLGPVSQFNEEGKYIKHKDQPMETAYRMVEWHWTEFRGRYETEDMTDWRNVPYKRYPRTYIPAPSIELRIATTAQGLPVLITDPLAYNLDNIDSIRHSVNLLLEIFGECQIFGDDLEQIIHSPLKRLNWQILPAGQYPWERLEEHVRPLIQQARQGNQSLIEDRFETINSYNPDFHAIGQAGFYGYLVFGFPVKGFFVLESIYTGNATYVFDENWEALSKMTKAEILNEHLQKDRIVHLCGWHDRISELLSS
jgi:hypothetical protein